MRRVFFDTNVMIDQIASAVCGRADYIVTNDKSGFIKSPIPVMTPRECAKQLLK